VTIPDPELFSTPNSPLLINLNSARLDLDLPYSYYDNGSLKRGSSGTKHVNFNRLWANVEHVLGGSQEDNSNYTVLVKSSARIINNSGARYPLTVKPFLKNSITGVVLKECAVNNDSETCINEISLPKSIFIPGSPLIVTFKTFATGMKDSDAILSSVDAKAMAGNHVYTEDDLIYALNHQQANSTITLESDIALRKPWEPIEKLSQIIFDGNGHKITGLKVNNKSDQQVGMFKFLVGPLTIKNLSLEGVVKSDVGNAGLIGGYLDGSNISILNSHFKSNVSAANMAGGLIGIMAGNSNANIKFESVTVDAIVTSTNTSGSGSAGGLISSVYSSTKFENIRINANIVGFNHLGGLAGFHGWRPIEVKNIIATAVIQTNQSAKSNIGGLLGHSNNQRLIGDRIDVFVNVTANNSTSVGGLVGQVDYFNSSLSNILVRGSIKTTTDPRERGNGIAGLALVKGGQVSIKNAIDKVTIIHGNKNYSSSLVTSESAVRFTADSANVFYALPAGVELLTLLPNTELVNPLSGTTADEEKTFLVSKGFDFNNTWTIKKDSANNDIIGIKEDSIPQFPKW
jgi:hypothetical protein